MLNLLCTIQMGTFHQGKSKCVIKPQTKSNGDSKANMVIQSTHQLTVLHSWLSSWLWENKVLEVLSYASSYRPRECSLLKFVPSWMNELCTFLQLKSFLKIAIKSHDPGILQNTFPFRISLLDLELLSRLCWGMEHIVSSGPKVPWLVSLSFVGISFSPNLPPAGHLLRQDVSSAFCKNRL